MRRIASRTAQVTTFIVIGLIILIVAGVIIYSISLLSKDETEKFTREILETPTELLPVRTYLQDCLEQTGKTALLALGRQGGYISLDNPEPYISGTTFTYDVSRPFESDAVVLGRDTAQLVPYWFYLDGPKDCVECELSSAQIPNIQEMEQQVSKYVEEQLAVCLDNFIELTRQGYTIKTFTDPQVQTRINDDTVRITLTYPLEVASEGKEITMKLFSEEYPVQLLDLYALSYLITARLAQSQALEHHFLLNIITLNAGPQHTLLPPIAAASDDPFVVTWDKNVVEARLKQLLQTYGSALQFSGFKNTQRYISNDSIEQGIFDALSIEVFNESSQTLPFHARIIYPDLPLYFEITPPAGEGSLRPEVQKTDFPLTSLTPFQRNLYEFYYTVSFPVIIELQDTASFNGEGYSFLFAYEVNIRDNKDLVQWNQGEGTLRFDQSNVSFVGNPTILGAQTPDDLAVNTLADQLRAANFNVTISDVPALTLEQFRKKLFSFPEQRISANITLTVVDAYNGTALDGVAVEFLCGSYASLSLGTIALMNGSSRMTTNLPLCFGDGRFEFRKEGYQLLTIFNQTIGRDTPLTLRADLQKIQTVPLEVNKKVKATPRFPTPEEIERIQNIPFLTREKKQKLIAAKTNAPATFEEFTLDNFILGQEEAVISLERVASLTNQEPFAVSIVKTGSKEATAELIPGDYKLQIVLFDNAGRTIQPKLHKICWTEGTIIKEKKCESYWIPPKPESFVPWLMGGVEFTNATCSDVVHIAAGDLYSSKKLVLQTVFFADPVVLQDLGQAGKIASYTTQNCLKLIPEWR